MSSERWNSGVLQALGLKKNGSSTKDIFPCGELLDLTIKERARPAVILVEGSIDPAKIVLEPSTYGIRHNTILDNHIDTVWNEAGKKFKEKFPDREFTNGSKVLARDITIDQDKVIIKTGITDYKERIATIKPEYQIAKKFGLESVAIQLATSSIILTRDNKICLAQLGTKTDEKPRVGGIHTIAGLLEMRENKTPTLPVENILNEISEELGFENEETQKHFSAESVLGIIQDPKIFATDIIYLIKADISEQEIRMRRERSDKEIGLVFIDNTSEAVRDAILVYAKTGTASALSGLYLYGESEFGNDWADSIRERLARRFTVWDRVDALSGEFPEEVRKRTANRLTRLHG
jgi:hypothetical protein